MFNSTKFICSISGCGQSFPLEQINHYEMYEYPCRNIQCLAPYCKFITVLETVINHYIKCAFHLIYCAECKTFSNVLVLKHDCKVIQAQRTFPFDIKFYHENPPLNHLHGDVLLRIHSFNESFEDYYQNRNDLLMSISHGLPSTSSLLFWRSLQRKNEVRNNSAWHILLPPLPLLPQRILQRQNGVEDLLSNNPYNYNDWSFSFFFFCYFFPFHLCISYSILFNYWNILFCKYY